jgi:prepilin-type N-terminal cleavage/methylation domain-containing protein
VTALSSRDRHTTHPGFTLTELLIVIVVIAILAALTTIAFNGIQTRARASEASSALTQAKKKLELYKVDNNSYPTSANLSAAGITDTDTTYQYTSDGTTYCLTATAATISYYLNSTTQSTPTSGGCAGHGQGGVGAVTNLATDPRATSMAGQIGWRTGRWAGVAPATTTHSLVTGAVDGPVGISTYIRKTWTVAPAAMGNSGDTGFDNYASNTVVNPGEIYTISCYLRSSVTRNFNVGIYQYTSAGAAFTTPRVYASSVTGAANQWTRVSYTYTVPAGVGQMRVVCDSSESAANGAANWGVGSTLDGTGLMITAGATLHNFADGSSPNWIWTVTANASTSTGPPL